MTEQDRIKAKEEFARRHPWAASMAFEEPWTEADEIFVETLTGEYDIRLRREKMSGKREKLICDTSFVGHFNRAMQRPDRYGSWGGVVIDRIEAGEPAVSIVTIAEVHAGYLNAGWGDRRLAEAERQFDLYRRLPIRWELAGEWARLSDAARARGISIGDNDLWIAATANLDGRALVTCDRDHERIASELGVEVVYLQPPV